MSYHFYDMGYKDGYKKALQEQKAQRRILEQRGGVGPAVGGGSGVLPGADGKYAANPGWQGIQGVGSYGGSYNRGALPVLPADLPSGGPGNNAPDGYFQGWPNQPWGDAEGEFVWDQRYQTYRWVPTGDSLGEWGPYWWQPGRIVDGRPIPGRWVRGFGGGNVPYNPSNINNPTPQKPQFYS